jgi:ATP-binding cassette subfamily A (ABC1) protein 3
MDPFSRRSTWNIIQRNKKGRVILLTTHFMDEADILGDRVAIMSRGKLQCCGSPLFLKNQYGVGYTLTIVKLPQVTTIAPASASNNHSNVDDSSSWEITSQQITSLIQSMISDAELLNDVGAEQSFRIPFSASSQFVTLFQLIDEKKKDLGIAEYGISVTTLEEVFLRVASLDEESEEDYLHHSQAQQQQQHLQDHDKEEERDRLLVAACPTPDVGTTTSEPAVSTSISSNNRSSVSSKGSQYPTNTMKPRENPTPKVLASSSTEKKKNDLDLLNDDEQRSLFWNHFRALLIKRAIYAKRDKRMIICQLVLPVILVIIGLSLLLIQPDLSQPDLVLSPSKWNEGFSYSQQNYVPFFIAPSNLEVSASPSSCVTCDSMKTSFQGLEGTGVFGKAITVSSSTTDKEGDVFEGCSGIGALPLFNMSRYLLSTPESDLRQEGGSSIYGSVTIADSTNTSQLIYNILVNASAVHAPGIFANLVHSSYLQALTGSLSASITTHNHPLPQTFQQKNESATVNAFVVSLFIMIAFCFIPASFAVFVVKEKEVKAKHQQVISGISIYAYWISTYLWDTISYLPTALLVITIMYAFGIEAYTKGSAASAVFALFLLYGSATAALTYLLSFLFVSHSSAQNVIMFFNFITGLCLMVISFVLSTIPSTAELDLSLRYFFRIFPSFCLGDGILQLSFCLNGKYCPSYDKNGLNFEHLHDPLSWDTTGADVTFLAIEIVVYFALTVLVEYLLTFPSLLAWLHKIDDHAAVVVEGEKEEEEEEDVDVRNERHRVAKGEADHDVVKLEELRKVYPAPSTDIGSTYDFETICCGYSPEVKVAVDSLSFGIPRGECFGFLGINGAGKTTTLSILSGEFPSTAGNAFIDGFNVMNDQNLIRRKIGFVLCSDLSLSLISLSLSLFLAVGFFCSYCPQFDALLELLTVREHLELYGRIKGLQGEALEKVVRRKIEQLDLKDFENKTAGSLSGGNKRKLSVAIATIGDPLIIFLDEPSTGMDPKARRFMWKGSHNLIYFFAVSLVTVFYPFSFLLFSDCSFKYSRCSFFCYFNNSFHGGG